MQLHSETDLQLQVTAVTELVVAQVVVKQDTVCGIVAGRNSNRFGIGELDELLDGAHAHSGGGWTCCDKSEDLVGGRISPSQAPAYFVDFWLIKAHL